jgi:hypothetical protein
MDYDLYVCIDVPITTPHPVRTSWQIALGVRDIANVCSSFYAASSVP